MDIPVRYCRLPVSLHSPNPLNLVSILGVRVCVISQNFKIDISSVSPLSIDMIDAICGIINEVAEDNDG